MAISLDDVRHVATLARLGVSDERASALVAELNGILGHMDALSSVNTHGVSEAVGTAASAPLRIDERDSVALVRPREAFAPAMRDGFLLVPRLASHENESE